MSEDAWMRTMLGIAIDRPPLPLEESRRAFLEHYAACSAERLATLVKSGVEPGACGNTMKGQKVTLKDLLPGFVSLEQGGVVRIAELQDQGYAYIRS